MQSAMKDNTPPDHLCTERIVETQMGMGHKFFDMSWSAFQRQGTGECHLWQCTLCIDQNSRPASVALAALGRRFDIVHQGIASVLNRFVGHDLIPLRLDNNRTEMVIKHQSIRHRIVLTETMTVKSGSDTVSHIKKASVYHNITGNFFDTQRLESAYNSRDIFTRQCRISIGFDNQIAVDDPFSIASVIIKFGRPAKIRSQLQ